MMMARATDRKADACIGCTLHELSSFRDHAERNTLHAIHRYPTELIEVWSLADRGRITVRPILPQDALLEQAFIRSLLWGLGTIAS
jgi:hypothetical protein